MPEPLKQFIDAVDDLKVDKAILKSEIGESAQDALKDFGQDLGESVKNLLKPNDKKSPVPPSGPTPTYKESVLEPKNSGSLYEATNTADKLPVVTKDSSAFRNIKYSAKGFGLAATWKNGSNAYSLLGGEKTGVAWFKKQGQTKTDLQATYNVRNGKSEVRYSQDNPAHSYNVSIFNKDGNNGASAYYYDKASGIDTVFAVDKKSATARVGVNRQYKNCNMNLSAYATTGEDYKNPFVGVSGRITF